MLCGPGPARAGGPGPSWGAPGVLGPGGDSRWVPSGAGSCGPGGSLAPGKGLGGARRVCSSNGMSRGVSPGVGGVRPGQSRGGSRGPLPLGTGPGGVSPSSGRGSRGVPSRLLGRAGLRGHRGFGEGSGRPGGPHAAATGWAGAGPGRRGRQGRRSPPRSGGGGPGERSGPGSRGKLRWGPGPAGAETPPDPAWLMGPP